MSSLYYFAAWTDSGCLLGCDLVGRAPPARREVGLPQADLGGRRFVSGRAALGGTAATTTAGRQQACGHSDNEREGVRLTFLRTAGPSGSTTVELLEPTRADTGVARYLERRDIFPK